MVAADVLRSIHRIEDVSRLCGVLGYHPHWRELPAGWMRDAPTGAVVARQGDFEWYAVLDANIGATRRLARALAARGLPSAIMSLDRASRCLVVAAADASPLTLSLEAPDPLGFARLERCVARPGELALATAFRIVEALESRGVDDRFFTGFRRVLGELTGALPARISLTDRHALALLQLTRILFLYFVEAKGWLDQRPRFLRDQVDRCLSARRSLHRDLLAPLFFGTLNRPFPERSALTRRFGAVPFLNGGLFEPHPLERRWRITVPTPVLREAFDSLFERFHFTLGAGSGESIAPDMLGRVFEGVMEPGERHGTGSYYTPAVLVDAILRDALAAGLEGSLGCPWCEARRRVDDPDSSTWRAFRAFRLLDPAVGSGAFLLGALRLLAGPDTEPGARRAARLRAILGRSLFGVDRNAAAVRLAELRLWLEVVAAEPSDRPASVEPLPNLDALVRQGDSLVDPTSGIPMPPPRGSRASSLGVLRTEVVRATGREKRAAISALLKAERDVAEAGLGGALEKIDSEVANLLELARSPNLFGGRRGLDGAGRARLGELRASRRRTRNALRALRSAGEVPWFHYPVHFADVFAGGGFDLVVGNPPWVRAEALPQPMRRYLSERFRWFRRTRDGGRGYLHQPDLAVGFLERALELAAPGGVVAFLLPAKIATTGYAARARDELSRRTTIVVAADLRTDPRAAFGATVYPMAVIARNVAAPGDHRVRLGLGPEAASGSVPQRSLGAGPWALVPDSTRAVLEQLRASGPALGDRFECHLGVKTGLNRVFLDPPEDIEPELVRWAVRGRDVRAFRVRAVRKILWPCDGAGRALDTLPPAAARHVTAHAGDLRRRADHHGGHPWMLFRTRAASAPHRVIWADVARRLEAAPLSGPLGARLIPLNTCYVLSARDEPMALRLAAWLNSTWCRAAAAAVADPASSGFARFNARVVASLPCPPAALGDSMLLDLGRAGVAGRLSQEELDERCATLLDLGQTERDALAKLAGQRAEPGR